MTRSASASLAGYSYQFNESIIRLLDLPSDDHTVTLEGIEDIDVGSNCVQVKYLPSQKLIPSAIKEPTSLMLEDYAVNYNQRQNTTYKIYAHFGDTSGNKDFLEKDVFYDDCVEFLINKEKKKVKKSRQIPPIISKEIIQSFKKKFSLEIGQTLEEKEADVKYKLKKSLNALDEDTSLFFYPNAINTILNISIRKEENERVISKGDFLNLINNKNMLFGLWQKLEMGEKQILLNIKTNIKNGDFRHNLERLVFIDIDHLSKDNTNYGEDHLLVDLAEKYRLADKNYTAKALTIIINLSENEMKGLKSYLIDNSIEYNDGHEHIKFSSNVFNKDPIININKGVSKKISKSSYEIKLITLSNYKKQIQHINNPRTAIYFSETPPFNLDGAVQYHIPIVKTYRAINDILK